MGLAGRFSAYLILTGVAAAAAAVVAVAAQRALEGTMLAGVAWCGGVLLGLVGMAIPMLLASELARAAAERAHTRATRVPAAPAPRKSADELLRDRAREYRAYRKCKERYAQLLADWREVNRRLEDALSGNADETTIQPIERQLEARRGPFYNARDEFRIAREKVLSINHQVNAAKGVVA